MIILPTESKCVVSRPGSRLAGVLRSRPLGSQVFGFMTSATTPGRHSHASRT